MITFIRTNPLLAQRLAALKAQALLEGKRATYAELLVAQLNQTAKDNDAKNQGDTVEAPARA